MSEDQNGKVVRRRIIRVSDSDSDCEQLKNLNVSLSTVPTPNRALIVEERERKVHYLIKVFPNLQASEVYEQLANDEFDLAKTVSQLEGKHGNVVTISYDKWKLDEKIKMQAYAKQKRPPAERKKASKAKRRKVDNSDSNDSDTNYADTRVFDSDEDSDVEISDVLTPSKKKVLEFMETATASELQLMHSCSKKKVDALLASRPFTGWIDLVEKLQGNKYLSTDLLNSAQRVISTRQNVAALMNKCSKISEQLEFAAKREHAIKSQPKNLSAGLKLTGYQLVGVNWLAMLHEQGLNGILADEMGLGKTIQVVAFLAHLKERNISGRHLIVVPASTLENWQNEFERWCPSIKVLLYYGSAEERRNYRIMFSKGEHRAYDVVLTTYNIVAGTPEERKMFRVTPMHYVVFDEAHMLKNMNTQRFETLSRVRATKRLLLTGTPLQNNLLELMSLLIFVMPNIFSAKTEDLKSLFQKNAKKDNDPDNTSSFEKGQVDHAKRIMKPFVLRRLKLDVLKDLPPKTDTKLMIPMSDDQETKYQELVAHFQEIGMRADSGAYNGMSMMTDLRKLANHPLLQRYHYTDATIKTIAKCLAKDPDYKDTVVEYIVDDLACMSDFDINEMTQEYPLSIGKFAMPKKLIPISGKFAYLDETLPQLKREGHRVLIFSQYVIMLNILEVYLKMRNHSFLRLDGNTPVTLRQQLINEYTEDGSIFIFLLSTRAGGLGINLTAADTVIIHDIDFNPYNDKQAEDRCHRMGQTRPVNVIRLVSKDTIEEAMWELTQEKLKLERDITTDDCDTADVKSVVSLLSTALKIDQAKVNNLCSPEKLKLNGKNSSFSM